MYVVLVDAHSKWLEVFPMSDLTARNLLAVLRRLFAQFGLPRELVSDNGPQLVRCKEYLDFCLQNGIKASTGAPHHPATNGQAENAVAWGKRSLEKTILEKQDVHSALCRFLLMYKNMPHSTTKVAPVKSMFGRLLRTRLSLSAPVHKPKKESGLVKQAKSSVAYKQMAAERLSGSREPVYNVGDSVLARGYGKGKMSWNIGKVVQKLGTRTYVVKLSDGRQMKRHCNQLWKDKIVKFPVLEPSDPLSICCVWIWKRLIRLWIAKPSLP